jgi:DNA-binding LytR/AlgR family response regulator
VTKAIIVDDERLMREQLRLCLNEAWPDLVVCGEAENAEGALDLLTTEQPDLVFLDIRMPASSGLELAKQIGQCCHIVFVTAYDQYAVEAFERGAVDYLMKPVDKERLTVTAERLRARLAERPANLDALLERLSTTMNQKEPQNLRWIQASYGQTLRMIAVDEVIYFQADDKYTRVLTEQSEALIKKPIKELVTELDPNQFWQIHRATVVNVKAIAGISRDLRGRQHVSLRGRGEKLEVSRSFAHLFRQM